MKILIIILGRIGDMILSTPMFSLLKNKFPNAEIVVLAGIDNSIILKNNPNVDQILIYDKNPLKLIKLYSQLKKFKFNILIDPKDHYSRESNLLAKLVKAEKKIGYIHGSKSPFNIGIDDSKQNESLHYIVRVLKSLIGLGIEVSQKIALPELYPDKETEKDISKLFTDVNKKIIIFNISAGSSDRLWPAENWISVIDSFDKVRFLPVLTYVKPEVKIANKIKSSTHIDCFTSDDFDKIIALIQRCDLLVSPDTSLIHVASAFNKPTLALYSGLSYNYIKFAPLSDIQEVVISKNGDSAIADIEYNKVIDKLSSLLTRI